MKILEFTIKLKSPVHIKSQRFHGNVNGTLSYIPGSTIFGALGNYLLRTSCELFQNGNFKSIYDSCSKCEKKCGFYDIILTPNKLVCNTGLLKTGNVEYDEIFRLLKTTQICRTDSNHVFDSLIFQLKEQNLNIVPKCSYRNCNSELKRKSKSVYYVKNNGKSSLQSLSVQKNIVTRTVIDRTLGAAKSGFLYHIEYLEPGQKFISKLLINEEKLNLIKDALKGIEKLGLGGNRNRGFGQTEIKIEKIYDATEYISREKQRIQKNTNRLSEILIPENKNFKILIITFKSDFYNTPINFIPTGNEFLNLISDRLNLKNIDVQLKLHKIFCKKTNKNQYFEQDSLFYNILSVLEAGSIIVYLIDNKSFNNILEPLVKTQLYHIGWFADRGFGNFICNSQIYLDKNIQINFNGGEDHGS